ncbi:lamin tail domain-containing protein [Pedobacter frigiditerrae]|uniref:lamin tail domain-containing protein n=1 Tax=Pedobacter frigiditerrae TaxID=2530452 RepID=UPI00292FDFFF|nr:lamin tail domain-containing protein [Pedobacter frigiditerrae]
MRKLLLFTSFLLFSIQLFAQVTLTTSPYKEEFSGLGTALPNGFTVRTGASSSNLGTAAILTTAATAWNNTTGAFKNFASATAGSAATTATQAAATDRALGLRQTGSIGDPNGAFVFQLANTTLKSALKLSFDLQSLDVSSPRVVTWSVDYGFGATPTTFTTATATGTLTTGGSLFTNNTINVDFGTALDNNAGPVWIRIVALSTSTGSGNRPTTGIDNFNLTFTSGATVVPTLSTTPTSLDFNTQQVNTSSAENSFVLNSANLNGTAVNLTTTAPFSISKTSGGTFSTSLNYSNAELTGSNTVYAKFTPTATGTFNEVINISGGGAAVSPTVSLLGVGQTGVITVDQGTLNFGNQATGTTSTVQTYNLSASNLTNNVTVSTSAPFAISKDNITFSTSINYTIAELATSKTVYVRFSPTAIGTFTENAFNASSGSSTKIVILTGVGTTPPAAPVHVVISEVYGGGGNAGATYKNDFIELYNPDNVAVNLTGWSVQYTSATGTGTWAKTDLTGSIPAKSFYLIQSAAGTGGTVNLPTPDVIGTLALSGTTGKVILSNANVALTGANPASAAVVDKVGFGPTATGFEGTPTAVISNTTSVERKASATSTAASLAVGGAEEFDGNGRDTDVNSADFVVTAPNPQNSLVKEPTGANHVVISEVYGGGGNSGSVYKNDFIELYNPTLSAVDLTGWSVQYASATGTSWQVTTLTGTIAPKSFYLVQQAAGTAGTTNLPTADRTGTIAMAAGAGKVLLANVATAQTGSLPTGTQIIDFVGYGATANSFEGTGPAPVPSATFSVERKASATSDAISLGVGGSEEFSGNGYDTDDNSLNFVSKVAMPQNATSTEPASLSGPYLSTTPKTLAFSNQAINTVSAAKTYVLSAGNLTNATTVTVSAPFSISKDNSTFSTSLSYTVVDLATNQTVYVKFNPTSAGNATGTILHASAGATSQNVTLTGPGIDPNQTAFSFENCTTVGSSALSDGFYQYSVTGAQTWGCTTTFGHDSTDPAGLASVGNALQINGFSSGNILNQDWLISPALNLSNMTYAVLSFWTRSAFSGDKLQLKVSTNYTGTGDPSLATWTNIDGKFPESGSDVWTKSGNIDLSTYKALPVYVAFVYNSSTSSASRWTVDDFAVTNSLTPPPVDITISNTSLNFGFQASGTTSAEKTFGFSAGNLTGDVTLTAPTNFTIASTSGGTFGPSVTYTKAAINNTSPTVYAKFSPTAVNTSYSGNVTIATAGSANKTVTLSGNTFDVANTLEVVNWNIEWFGSPAQDPANDTQQAANVKTIVNNINADVYGLAEVVDTALFRATVLPAGYNVIFSSFGSYADNKLDVDYPSAQKLAFMYRTDIIKPVRTFGVLEDTYNPAVASTSADGTPYKNWSSGRFPFAMEANITINGKTENVYFMEIHAKANTGTPAEQVDSYNRRKGGNLQLKNWIDANLQGKKVIILGDFNDVLNPDKTIAPMPTGTGTSYSDFTNDAANYFPITLPLALAGKQSTAGFNTVIDNVIVNKALNANYIQGTAEVLDGVTSLVTNYSSTTTDHYPIKTRYLFGNGEPTLATIANATVCYSPTNQTIALTGITAGAETTQTTTLSVTSDNANLFDVLTVASTGTTTGAITYRLKNNVAGVANITVTVTDNGGTDFGGVNNTSKTFKLTVNGLATATIAGTTAVPQNATAPTITFTGANGVAPYTFIYNINGATNRTVSTTTGNSVTVTAPTNVVGSFAYNLVSVADANCSQTQTGTATVLIRPLPVATIAGTTVVCINSLSPTITFTGSVGTAPYTFTYSINGGSARTVTTSSTTATVTAPSNVAGTFTYTLVSVADAYATQAQTGSAVVNINTLPVINISGNTSTPISKGTPVMLSATGGVSYSWSPSTDIVTGQGTANLTVRPKQTTTYAVTVTNASGCTSNQSITIAVEEDYKIKPLNILTPNGDGKNDKFTIENIDYYPNNTLKIFDRSGRIVYTKKGYANEWDGTYNGTALASDTYYYILDFGTNISQFKGYITIIRN